VNKMNKTKILIVEDETIVAMEIKVELEKLNCTVIDIVSTQKEVQKIIKEDIPDIIIMDINLGKNENGIDIVTKMQKEKNIPILYLTAFSDDENMAKAFATNPIGYIVKPFNPQDLKIHIQLAVYKLNLFHKPKINKNYIALGEDFYFDAKNKKLYFRDSFIKLGRKEQHLLFLLVEANHSKIPFAVLEEALWPGQQTSTSALRTLVYRLKGKIGDNIIQVCYGYGYCLKSLH